MRRVLLTIACLLWITSLSWGQGAAVSGPLSMPDGAANCSTVGLPFAADTDTGIVRTAANSLGLCANGVLQVTVNASGLSLTAPLPVASGGTGLTAGTSGGILGYTATGTLASSAALTANAIVLGGGAGATPIALGSLGTTATVLHGNAAGAPTFGAVSLTADVSGTLPVGSGGTGAATYTTNGVLYGAGTSALLATAQGPANSVLTANAGAPAFSATPTVTSLTTTGDATVGDQLLVSGVGPHAMGGATNATVQWQIFGTFAERTGVYLATRLQPPVNQSGSLLRIEGTIDEAGSGTHALFSAVRLDPPTITAGVAALTDATTLYISNAPTGATNNHALWSAAGLNRFDGNIAMLAGTDIRPTSDSTTAINIANAAGTDFVTFDTTNSRVGFGLTGAEVLVHISGNSSGALLDVLKIDNAPGTLNTEVGMVFETGIDRLARISAQHISGDIGDLKFWTAGSIDTLTERMRITSTGNVLVGTTSVGTSAAGVLALKSGTCGTTFPADQAEICVKDINAVAGQAGFHLTDELGGTYKIGAGIMWASGTKPACAAGIRGTVYYVAGGAGVLDTFEVCRKDASDVYAWLSLF